jgi:hypothetical protein
MLAGCEGGLFGDEASGPMVVAGATGLAGSVSSAGASGAAQSGGGSDGSGQGGAGNAAGAGGSSGGAASAGTAAAGGGVIAGNGGMSAGAGGSAAGAGGTTAGTGGTPAAGSGGMSAGSGGTSAGSGGTSAGSGGTSAGSGGSANTTPVGITVTSQTVDVQGKGTVFNIADNYFNDGLSPATPVANFGCHSQITTVVNDDGSLDVAWLDYANGKGRPWSLTAPGTIYVTHVDAALTSATTQSTGLSSYKLLGFTKDAAGAFYVAYNRDHALKNSTQGDPNNINGNELHVAKLSGGNVAWDQLVFGNQDNKAEASLGDPGGAASGVLAYDPTHQKLVLYVGHSMMWMPTRHQAGFLRLLNPSSGAVLAPAGNDVVHFGAGWWYSHNFNQRLLIDGGNYYVLAHGDAYARQLGFARWSVDGYTNNNSTDFDQSYFTIAGGVGDNNTNAQTGQFARLSNGKFVIVHTTSQGRSARDVRVVLASAATGAADANGARWLTTNQGTVQATMPKVEQLGDQLLVTYALWDSTKKHDLVWYAALLDAELATVAAPRVIPGVEFVDAAPLLRLQAGPNAGKVAWVSGNSSHTLAVRVASLRYD